MGVDDDEAGYGFARVGNPERKKVGRRKAAPVGPPPSKQPRFPHPPVLSGDRAPMSQKPPWVWLLIGFLLGTGGTLLTSSFWLPESGDRAIAGLESSDSASPDQGEAPDHGAVKAATDDRTPDEPRPTPTSVAALNIEEPAAPPPVDEASPSVPDRAESAGASEAEVNSEPAQPIVARDVVIDSDREAALAKPPAARRDAEDVLATLVSRSRAELRQEERAGRTDPDQARRLDPNPPAPALAASSDDAEPAARTLPNSLEAEPSGAADRVDLPPRIRQALLTAKAERPTTSKQDAGRDARLYRVQLAAVDNEAAARIYWREVNRRLPGAFNDVEPIYDQRVVAERSYLRIWVGAFDNRVDADGYCGWLKEQGQDCFVTRVDNL